MKVSLRALPAVSALALALAGAYALFGARASYGQDAQFGHGQPEPNMGGIVWERGHSGAAKPGGGGGSPDLTWHGGPIMPSATVSAIFWGTSWSNPGFVGDKITGLGSFYSGMSNSGYAGSSDEYTANNTKVGSTITYTGGTLDTSPGPTHAPRTSAVLDEVCKVFPNPTPGGYYPVYTDLPRGHAGYCAWHSSGSCNGTTIEFAFFFNLDGDPGCDPQDTSTTHSQGLAALANVSGHELSEARTDPLLNAWYDSSGAENADKCAWTFGHPYLTFSNNTKWKVQGNWSNAAYDGGGTGYDGAGCIDGG